MKACSVAWLHTGCALQQNACDSMAWPSDHPQHSSTQPVLRTCLPQAGRVRLGRRCAPHHSRQQPPQPGRAPSRRGGLGRWAWCCSAGRSSRWPGGALPGAIPARGGDIDRESRGPSSVMQLTILVAPGEWERTCWGTSAGWIQTLSPHEAGQPLFVPSASTRNLELVPVPAWGAAVRPHCDLQAPPGPLGRRGNLQPSPELPAQREQGHSNSQQAGWGQTVRWAGRGKDARPASSQTRHAAALSKCRSTAPTAAHLRFCTQVPHIHIHAGDHSAAQRVKCHQGVQRGGAQRSQRLAQQHLRTCSS